MKQVNPCPKCGDIILSSGKPVKVADPQWLRRLKLRFPIGVTCCRCGYYKHSIRAWNKEARRN